MIHNKATSHSFPVERNERRMPLIEKQRKLTDRMRSLNSLMENYDRLLINLDSPLQKNRDVRRGMEHAVIANCNGLWVDGNFLDYPAVPNDLRSAMWLGVVEEDMVEQLTFVFNYEFEDPASVAGGGWLQTIVPVTFGQQARALAPSFKAPFGAVPALTVEVTSATSLADLATLHHRSLQAPQPQQARQQREGASSIRARAWAEPCESVCAHLVVVNIDQSSPKAFTLAVHGLQPAVPLQGHTQLPAGATLQRAFNATRLFTASYNVSLSAAGSLSVRKTASFLEFSLCLSRACLGKIIVFIYKWLKNPVFRRTG